MADMVFMAPLFWGMAYRVTHITLNPNPKPCQTAWCLLQPQQLTTFEAPLCHAKSARVEVANFGGRLGFGVQSMRFGLYANWRHGGLMISLPGSREGNPGFPFGLYLEGD